MSNISSDTSSYRSDVLSVLNNIEAMFRMSQNVLCNHAANGLLFAMAMEAQMLALKLDTMADRWRIHIPFKEACKVDFLGWAKKIEQMSQYLHDLDNDADVMDIDAYCPDKHFLLDLYTRLLAETYVDDEGISGNAPSMYYNEINMQAFVERQDSLHKTLAEHWVDYLGAFSEITGRHLVANALEYSESGILAEMDAEDFSVETLRRQIACMSSENEDNINITCWLALRVLSRKLYALNESLERNFSLQHFVRLTERILIEREYGGTDILTKVRTDIAQWNNATPDDEIDNGRNEEMQKAYSNIVAMKFRRNFQDYIKSYTPDIDQKKSAIGKFLFHCRADITVSELQEFMANLFRIIHHRKDQLKDIEENPAGESPSVLETVAATPDIYLSEKLSSSREAKRLFFSLLSNAGPYICRQLTFEQKKDASVRKYEGWSWRHLKQAFTKLGLIEAGLSDKDFFKFLSIALPGRTCSSISQGYYRTKHDPKDGIVEKVVEEFRQVAEMMG
ncbi:MAG: hypothetical protein IJY03_06160 [Prevotella sp.]|nr:hypothetical protein [Prevotella sp.]